MPHVTKEGTGHGKSPKYASLADYRPLKKKEQFIWMIPFATFLMTDIYVLVKHAST